MRRTRIWLAALLTYFLGAGCIVSDQVTTITVQADGSADWTKFQSNIRSSEEGAKGQNELQRFVEEFNAQKDWDHVHIVESGGEVVESRWVRRAEPYATVAIARFSDWAALKEFMTVKNSKGEVIAQPQFSIEGNRRKLSFVLFNPKENAAVEPPLTIEQLRQEQANGISETRFVVAGGRIIATQGFAVASDKRSAIFDLVLVHRLLRSSPDKIELFIEWELSK